MSNSETRLKIAIQKSGRLTDEPLKLLEQCGIKLTKSRDQLFCKAQNFPLDVYFVRDDDIPAFVAGDVCQIGIVGQNVLFEKKPDFEEGAVEVITELGFGKCRLSLAVPQNSNYDGIQSLNNKTIATSYKAILSQFLKDNNLNARIVSMEGAVEIAPRMKLADAVCDLVSTGTTLLTNGLEEKDVILRSQAVLIKNNKMDGAAQAIMDRLMLRIDGVRRAAASKYIMLHCQKDRLTDIKQALPGSESPTILPLAGNDNQVAVHAVCEESVFWETMEDLKRIGASSILVVPIEKMLD